MTKHINAYNKVRASIPQSIRLVQRKVERLLICPTRSGVIRKLDAGRFDSRRAHVALAGGTTFRKKAWSQPRQTTGCYLLIDGSSSMSWDDRSLRAREFAVALSETFEKAQATYEVGLFSSGGYGEGTEGGTIAYASSSAGIDVEAVHGVTQGNCTESNGKDRHGYNARCGWEQLTKKNKTYRRLGKTLSAKGQQAIDGLKALTTPIIYTLKPFKGASLRKCRGSIGAIPDISTGGTPDVGSILHGIERLLCIKENRKILFVITDGDGDGAEYVKYAKELAERYNICVVGIAIDSGHIKEGDGQYTASVTLNSNELGTDGLKQLENVLKTSGKEIKYA